MAEFELPTSLHMARERVPPEVDQLGRYLAVAVELVPDVAPVLTLGAVTGMRRGELVSVRRSAFDTRRGRLRVDTAIAGRRVKTTKTRVERDVTLDESTIAMLERHCAQMDARADQVGVQIGPGGFVFSLEPDCSLPMPAEYLTRQVAKLKAHLGIATKRPEVVALEDEALRLFRQKPGPGRRACGALPRRAACRSRRSAGRSVARVAGPSWRCVPRSGGRNSPHSARSTSSTVRSSP
jgi:integrase